MNTMDAHNLARLAYYAIVDNAAKLQMDIIQQEAVNARFGVNALSVNKMLRGRLNNLREGQRKCDITQMMQRHDEYIAAIREFEKLFEIEENKSIEEFARAFAKQCAGAVIADHNEEIVDKIAKWIRS